MNPDEIERAIAALKAQGAPDEAIHAFLQEHLGPPVEPPAPHDYHAEFKSGALAKRMQGANAREAANVAEADAAEPGYLERLGTHVLNAAQGIPGVEAVEAAAGSLGSQLTGHPQNYRTALQTLRERTGQIGTGTNLAEKAMGSVATLPFLPASPAKAGAALGAADAMLDADPDAGLGTRAAGAAFRGGIGAGFGKLSEGVIAALRGKFATPTDLNLLARGKARDESAKALYDFALGPGAGRQPTRAVQQFLAKPDIAEIVSELQQTRPFQGVQPHDPRMLDAIYKVLSDREGTLRRGLDAVTPNRPNIGRFRLEDVEQAKRELLSAMEQPETQTTTHTVPSPATAQSPAPSLREALSTFDLRKGLAALRQQGTVMQQKAREALERHGAEDVVSPPLTGAPGPRTITETTRVPGMMPNYRAAVSDYATQSRGTDAVMRGHDALKNRMTSALPTGTQVVRKSPEALSQWAATATDAERRGAAEGILGALHDAPAFDFKSILGTKILPSPSDAVRAAPDLLRRVGDPGQVSADALVKLGLLPLHAATE